MEPVETLITEELLPLFEAGMAALRAHAEQGDPGAGALLEELGQWRAAAHLLLEDEPDLWLAFAEGELGLALEPPATVPVRLVAAIPPVALRLWLAELEGLERDPEAAARQIAASFDPRLLAALGDEPLDFELCIEALPDEEDVHVRVGLLLEELPDEPTFRCTIAWDDLEALRDRKADAQTLFLGGKLRLSGDYTRAMQVVVGLMQD